MGWTYEYLKSLSGVDKKTKCPNRKNNKRHKVEFWWGSLICKYCGATITDD